MPYILKALQGGPPTSAALRGFRDCTEAVCAARKMVASFEESELPYAVQIEDASGEVIWECSISDVASGSLAPAGWNVCHN